MTNITMAVEPMVIVSTVNDFSLTVGQVFDDPGKLQELHDNNWSVEIFWFPFNSLSWRSLIWIWVIAGMKGGPTYGIMTEVYTNGGRIPQ